MPNFEDAYNKVLRAEGGYCWDESDSGGETAFGVARAFWPSWGGWPFVDAVKAHLGVPAGTRPNREQMKALTTTLKGSNDFMSQVLNFYKVNFWDRMGGDLLPYPLAYMMFQLAVNAGVGQAVKYLQECLNYMNKQGALFPDLLEDGGFGGKTLAAVQAVLKQRYDMTGGRVLLCMLRSTQVRHYQALMKRKPSQEDFCYGWIIRAFTPIEGEEAI